MCLMMMNAPLLRADRNKQALRSLEKNEVDDALEHLAKSIEKDSINPGAYYIYATILSNADWSYYDLDSSYVLIRKSIVQHGESDEKILKELEKNLISLSDLETTKTNIESMAYDRARDLHQVESYEFFMDYYREAQQVPQALGYRNQLVFAEVEKANTWQAYRDFIENYPEAIQVPEAEKTYQKLLFEDQTNDGKLSSLEDFVANHPDNDHRDETEKRILEIRAGLNRPADYIAFLEDYPRSVWNKEVLRRFFHLDRDFHDLVHFDHYADIAQARDSLLEVVSLNQASLLPVYESGLYGFIDMNGAVILEPQFDYIKEEYFCGNIFSDVLEVRRDQKLALVNHLGESVYEGGFDQTSDLRGGLVKMRKNGKFGAWHKSGIDILPAIYDDLDLLGANLIKVKLRGQWGLFSVFGDELLEPQFDDIYLIENYWIFEKDGLLDVVDLAYLQPLTDGETVSFDFRFEEVELVKDNYLLCFSGDQEMLINQQLEVIIEANDQTIIPLKDNWLVKRADGYQFFHEENGSFLSESFEDISYSDNWFSFKRDSTWTLLSEGFGFEPRFGLDSVQVLNDRMAYFAKGDTSRLVFYPNSLVELRPGDQITLLGQPYEGDSSQYLLIESEDIKRIYSEMGEFKYNSKSNELDYLSSGYFSYEWRGRKGILNANGKVILKAEYDGIGQIRDSIAPVLQKGLFGYYDLAKKELLKPAYKRRIVDYGSAFQLALKEEGYGFLSDEGEEISEFNFKQVAFWNDSVALVKTEDHWAFYNIEEEETVIDGILEMEYLVDDDEEKIAYMTTSSGIGVISNVRGEIINPSFNYIINLGTTETPLYFAEKHVPEADFYVVVYANASGETIRSQAYRPPEYEKILCEN